MDILATYDVNTETKAGRKRLRSVAQICLNYGQRVQKSVFECTVDEMQMEVFRRRLLKIINKEQDSLRIYRLRGGRKACVECYGRNLYVDYQEPLIR